MSEKLTAEELATKAATVYLALTGYIDAAKAMDSIGRHIAALQAENEALRAGRDAAEGMLASCTDLANTWARESYVQEAASERSLQRLIGDLWNASSLKRHEGETENEALRKDKERLDWLDKMPIMEKMEHTFIQWNGCYPTWTVKRTWEPEYRGNSIRAAIDAALAGKP